MSRAYQISVSESASRVIRGEDHVRSRLEILEVLPCDEMSVLIGGELKKEGFEVEGNTATLTEGGLTVTVDLSTGEVEVRTEHSRNVEESATGVARGYDDTHIDTGSVRAELRKRITQAIDRKEKQLQDAATDELEGALGDIRRQLDKAVNRATAEALKQKAARLGQIKEISEDENGLKIVVEV